MSRPPRRTFQLTLVDAGGSEIPLVNRLRSLLKSCLRSWRLRCTRAVELPGDQAGDEDSAQPDTQPGDIHREP
jgi:hypothetical protein